MKKLAVILAVVAALASCKATEDLVPSGASYLTTQQTLFAGSGEWAMIEYDNNQFACVAGYIYNRGDAGTPTGNRLTDGTGAEITCDDTLFWRTVITRTS